VVIQHVLTIGGKAAGAPGGHENVRAVKECKVRLDAIRHGDESKDNSADTQVDEGNAPDEDRDVPDVGLELLFLAFADHDLERTTRGTDQERQSQHDDPLTADVCQEMAPHVQSLGNMIQVLQQKHACRRVPAHCIETCIEE